VTATNTLAYYGAELKTAVKSFMMQARGLCYKNSAVNYRGNFNPTFLGLKSHINLLSYPGNLPPFQGKFNAIKITMLI